MSKVTSKSGKDYNYNYFACHLYFDLNDPYQKECADLLKKVGRNKNTFFSILIHQFMNQFKMPDNISTADIKDYLSYFKIASKMNSDAMMHSQMPLVSPTYSANNSEREQVSNIITQDIEPDNINSADEMVDNSDVLDAMNMFKV